MANELGQQIKALRKKKQMTLKQVADQTGFSISFISQLERGKSSATLESLKKISLALGVNPSYFFETTTKNNSLKQPVTDIRTNDSDRIIYRRLNSDFQNSIFQPLKVTLQPGQNDGNLITHKGQEFLYVLSGQLTVQVEEERHHLEAHQSIFFDSSRPHYWYNFTDKPVVFLCISYEPSI